MQVPGRLRMALRRLPLYDRIRESRQQRAYQEWIQGGKATIPPAVAKVEILRGYAKRFGPRVFVETGTFLGDTTAAMRDLFDRLYTIELDPDLHRGAVKRFARDPRVTLLQGDSGVKIAEILAREHEPILFWLDGHYSWAFTAKADKDTPIEAELAHIAGHPRKLEHVLLIDDAACFNGTNDYPTVDVVERWAAAEGFGTCEVADNIIRIHR